MPLTDEQRGLICTEADSWFGTPYRGWSCAKGVGTDCGQYLYGVYHGLGFIPEVVLPKDYSLQVAQHQVSWEYVNFIARYMREINVLEAKPGDVVVYKFAGEHAFAHAAIILEWPNKVIHCFVRGVRHSHGTNMPKFRTAGRIFYTLKDEFCVQVPQEKKEEQKVDGVPLRITTEA